MYTLQKSDSSGITRIRDWESFEMACKEMFLECQRTRRTHGAAAFRVCGPTYITPWCTDGPAELTHLLHSGNDPAALTEIQQNELITYAQCGTTRLQQLVDLFGEMVQDKSGDPATRIQRIDALADIIRNQLQELQTIATPTK